MTVLIRYIISSCLIISHFIFSIQILANDIDLTNASIVDRNSTEKYAVIEFDVSWDNSFRTSTDPNGADNWDAAWVFIKWRKTNDSTAAWDHGTLGSTGHTMPSGYTYSLPSDHKGIFIYRSSVGNGTASVTGAQVRWNFGGTGGDGLANQDEVDIELFAIEMVYVPQGSFYVGSGGDGNWNNVNEEYASFTDGSWVSGNTIPFQITSENALELGGSAGKLWGTIPSGSFGKMGPAGTLPAAFPKGYDAFYSMKYEITQGQFVDFLNHLDRTQQEGRIVSDPLDTLGQLYIMVGPTSSAPPYNWSNRYRNAVRTDDPLPASGLIDFYCDLDGDGIGNGTSDGQNIACNYMYWEDFTGYLDWAGLRPMTELEYEKACRGVASPVANEFAWGTTGLHGSRYSLTNAGKSNETATASTTTGNALYSGTSSFITAYQGPYRAGVFATTGTSRTTSGASYWGIMDLTGNVEEYIINVAVDNALMGRGYDGEHGDGYVNTLGTTDITSWHSGGSGRRGGAFGTGATGDIRVSNRRSATYAAAGNRYWCGGRGIRTAP